jgi:hypothetical protein
MFNQTRQRILKELADVFDPQQRHVLHESGHFVVDDITVGMLVPDDASRNALHVYLDLGPIPEHRRAQVHESMLRSNLRPDDNSSGHFGVHPQTRHAAFHMRLQGVDRIHGADLLRFIVGEIEALEGWLDRVGSATIRRAA